MSIHLLSNELPRSRRLSVALVLIVLLLALAPFLFPGARHQCGGHHLHLRGVDGLL
jgi:hypothetical protein